MASPHDRVFEYAFMPPGPADQWLRVTEILRRKAGSAWRALGEVVPPLLGGQSSPGSSEHPDASTAQEELRRLFRGWRADAAAVVPSSPTNDAPAVVAVRGPFDGWLAAISHDDATRIVVRKADAASTSDPRAVLDVARAAAGAMCAASPSRVRRAFAEVEEYLAEQRAAADAGVIALGSRAQATAANRIAALAASAPAHRRVAVSRLAASARQAVAKSRTAGAERLLSALVDSADAENASPESWLSRLIETSAGTPPNVDSAVGESRTTVRAVILIVSAVT
jgi:hypothetical protein